MRPSTLKWAEMLIETGMEIHSLLRPDPGPPRFDISSCVVSRLCPC